MAFSAHHSRDSGRAWEGLLELTPEGLSHPQEEDSGPSQASGKGVAWIPGEISPDGPQLPLCLSRGLSERLMTYEGSLRIVGLSEHPRVRRLLHPTLHEKSLASWGLYFPQRKMGLLMPVVLSTRIDSGCISALTALPLELAWAFSC